MDWKHQRGGVSHSPDMHQGDRGRNKKQMACGCYFICINAYMYGNLALAFI